MKPLVSIVIPFYNDPYIAEAIESALAQTYMNKEIIVVDDGSTSFMDRIKPYRSRIKYARKNNGGTASALNHGIRRSSGSYITWLSSDDRFYPKKLEVQTKYLVNRGGYISHTNFDLINSEGHITESGAGMKIATASAFYHSFFEGNPINGCTIMMKRDLLKRVGQFDEGLPYTHDLDLWYRVMLAGYDFHYIPDRLTAYRRHDAMGTVRHRDAIAIELQRTNSRYHPALRQFIQHIFHS
ncbi:glycosyltransferase [Paenibacillus marinisediminis]